MSSFLSSLKPSRKTFVSDAIAEFSTGLLGISEGMAYTQLAGVNAQPGIGASLDQAREAGQKWLAGQKQLAAMNDE